MTKRDFFRILIKLAGIYLFAQTIVSIIPAYINMMGYMSMEPLLLIFILLSAIVVLAVCSLLIFSPTSIINWFKLDKDYDDPQVEIKNIDMLKILEVGIIIVGGLLLVWSIVPLFMDIVTYLISFISYNSTWSTDSSSIKEIISDIVYLSVGYLLLTNYKRIALFLSKKNRNEDGKSI